jgi:hypothetical protein
MISSVASVKPPKPPWRELNAPANAGGYLSIYYSEDLSRLPIRWVTKPGDTKSDPNLETLTYGMFSFCGYQTRSGVIRRKYPHLFFATLRKGERGLTGYYHIGWFAKAVSDKERDFCLAADAAHFIENPIPLTNVDGICGTNVSRPFRTVRLLSGVECKKMINLIYRRPNAISAYLEEIERLERFNLAHGGYRYFTREQKEKFSWDIAARYLKEVQPPSQELVATARAIRST